MNTLIMVWLCFTIYAQGGTCGVGSAVERPAIYGEAVAGRVTEPRPIIRGRMSEPRPNPKGRVAE